MIPSLPKYVTKYFWGDNLNELNWQNHQQYITQTILEKGDREAAEWLLQTTNKSALKQQLNSLKLNPKSANFWKIYLS